MERVVRILGCRWTRFAGGGVIAVTLFAFLASGSVAVQPIQVFILAGQSNMTGQGRPVSNGTGATPDLLMYRKGAWVPAADPVTPLNGEPNYVGPAMTFGIDVLSHEPPGTEVGLIMCAEAATTIRQWQPTKLYRFCKDAAQASGGTVAGFVFLQGESDAARGGGATWATLFGNLERQVETDFGPIPFVLGQIGTIDSKKFRFQQSVRDAQATASIGRPEIAVVPSSDLPIQRDGVHFTVDSAKTLGTRFGEAWWALTQGTAVSVSSVAPAAAPLGATVTIQGSSFTGAESVRFGGVDASFSVDSDNQITATVPDGAPGGPVVVTTPVGLAAGAFALTPTVTSFTPDHGVPGAVVFISGSAFTGATSVTINGIPLVKVKVGSSSLIKARIPVGATTGPLEVTTPAGSGTSAQSFSVP